jgi:hypothetical protein
MITTSSSAKAALITGLDHLGKLGKEAGSGWLAAEPNVVTRNTGRTTQHGMNLCPPRNGIHVVLVFDQHRSTLMIACSSKQHPRLIVQWEEPLATIRPFSNHLPWAECPTYRQLPVVRLWHRNMEHNNNNELFARRCRSLPPQWNNASRHQEIVVNTPCDHDDGMCKWLDSVADVCAMARGPE